MNRDVIGIKIVLLAFSFADVSQVRAVPSHKSSYLAGQVLDLARLVAREKVRVSRDRERQGRQDDKILKEHQ